MVVERVAQFDVASRRKSGPSTQVGIFFIASPSYLPGMTLRRVGCDIVLFAIRMECGC